MTKTNASVNKEIQVYSKILQLYKNNTISPTHTEIHCQDANIPYTNIKYVKNIENTKQHL